MTDRDHNRNEARARETRETRERADTPESFDDRDLVTRAFVRWMMRLLVASTVAGCDLVTLDLFAGGVPGDGDGVAYYVATSGEPLRVRAVNEEATACLDGKAEACAIDAIDWSAVDLGDLGPEVEAAFGAGHAIARGWMGAVRPADTRDEGAAGAADPLDTLHVTEVWLSAVPVRPQGVTYHATGLDVLCVREPCPTHAARAVNAGGQVLVHDLDLDASGAATDALERGYQAVDDAAVDAGAPGLLVSGSLVELTIDRMPPGQDARALVAETFYTRVP